MAAKTDDPALTAPPAEGGLDEDTVARYLLENPEFFLRHGELLGGLALPPRHDGDGVVDMQQYLMNRLREEIDNLRDCAQHVIETSRSNMSNQTRIQLAALAMIDAGDAKDLVAVVEDDLPRILDVDVASVGFEPAAGPTRLPPTGVRPLTAGAVTALLGVEQDVALLRDLTDDGSLFGAGAGLVCSAAVARMRPFGVMPGGLLAFGSRQADAFGPGQGTELIAFLARVAERCFAVRLGWQI